LVLALASCSAASEEEPEGDGSEEAISAGQCDVFLPTGRKATRASLDDPFFKLVLNVKQSGAACPNKTKVVLDRVKAEAKKDPSVFAVSEEGDKPGPQTGYRFVLTQESATTKADELFFSSLGSAAGVSPDFLEVMAWSPKKKGYNYYHLKGGKWELAGNGADVKTGAAPAFECAGCHTSGGPLMKEQQDSWANWHSTWFSMPAPSSNDVLFKDFHAKKVIADRLETTVAEGTRRHTTARVERELAARNVKGLLRQVMCDVAEPNIVASHSRISDRYAASVSAFPGTVGSVFLNQLLGHDSRQRNYKDLMGLGVSVDVSLDGASYTKALASAGVEVPTAAGLAKDAMFPMFVPDRGFADNAVVEELLTKGILDKDLAADLLMTDFTVSSYSKVRCGLAETAPNEGTNAEEIRVAWARNLAGSALPGAQELKARLDDKADFAKHGATAKKFLDACRTRASSDREKLAEDVLRVVAQRRVEFQAQYERLVESEALLPRASKWRPRADQVRLDANDCSLKGL